MANELGLRVVLATSEPVFAHREKAGVISLPYITEANFDQCFFRLLAEQEISLVFSPHAGIWSHLQSLSTNSDSPVTFSVCNESPFETNWFKYGAAYEWARACVDDKSLPLSDAAVLLPVSRYANLHYGYNQIPGQNDDIKLQLLASVARAAPLGDIVEIGCLYGRSAFALAWLAKCHDIGPLICVDPWEATSIQNQGDGAALLNRQAFEIDWQKVFRCFIASLSGFDNVNYIRKPSGLACDDYRLAAASEGVCTEEFGNTEVRGEISIIHIDGNHRYEDVRLDIDTWLPFVKEGGWVLIDDYLWAFGDGPRRAGDEVLQEREVRTAFVFGDTLCIQL
ncbi:MAG TPA: class I SAM-dependent methyltransferase [Eoetvoesiella sp.]